MNLDQAVTYDIETFPNCFTLAMECLNSDTRAVWEISHRRDNRQYLIEWLMWLARTQTPMIGFNNIHFDYPVIHAFFHNPNMTVEQIYQKAMSIIQSDDRFVHTVWASDRFTPQIDLFKMNHFDNKAKSTSLKWLQINMRSDTVEDMPVPVGTMLTNEQIDQFLIPYNIHDVSRTKDFTRYNKAALDFRANLIDQFDVDVMNWNDTKIGEQMIINRLGDEVCYDRSTGRRRQTRQTVRSSIALNDIIFPYVQFEHPEFNRVLDYLRSKTIVKEEWEETLKTKGVFTDLSATVGGLEYHFGVGGIHGSLERKKFVATDEWLIKDVDVASLYPSIAIQNRLAPAHLGETFSTIYSELPKERKKWQQEKGKKCVEANALKLAANGSYGKSNSIFSPLYDPQFTMTITVNGQLLLCMLAEQLVKIPALQVIQCNTDGITYVVHRDYLSWTQKVEQWWQDVTRLVLEEQFYTRMWMRDVNSYVAESKDGSLKLKGAYWFPDPADYHKSVAEAQPPAWHKNLSNMASVRAAVAAMVDGVDPEAWLRFHTDPYDFMCAVKSRRKDQLVWGGQPVQKTTRYYITTDGQELLKIAPPAGRIGAPKRRNGVSEREYLQVMESNGWQWDGSVCTKNRSVYEDRKTAVCAGHKVSICNNVADFNWSSVNYSWYVAEAQKLII